jgi:hypothetical protein
MTRSEKIDDWSVPVGRKESSGTTKSSPLRPPGPKLRVRLGIKLVFPGGERESQTYSVHKFLSVQAFIQRMREDLMKTTNQISLFVSPNWRLLNHTGTVSDEVIPGTNTPCPFLYQGSTVRVEWGNRQVSLVGDTVISPKRPTRGGEWGNKSPEERLRAIKGISAGPVKWYSKDRPRANPQLIESADTANEPQLKRKRGESQQALKKAQVAEKPKPLKGGKRRNGLDRGQRCDTPDPRTASHLVEDISPNVGRGIGDDVVMIVKIRKNDCEGTQQAFVEFQFTENRGETGPLKMGVTIGQLLNYYDQWKTDTESDSESTSSDSDGRESRDEQKDDTSTSGDDSSGFDEIIQMQESPEKPTKTQVKNEMVRRVKIRKGRVRMRRKTRTQTGIWMRSAMYLKVQTSFMWNNSSTSGILPEVLTGLESFDQFANLIQQREKISS